MSIVNISYNQLLTELEKKLRDLRNEPYTPDQRLIMQETILQFFYQLTNWDGSATKDAMDLVDRLNK
ncbi:TPA: hypothetical protein SCS19_005169 [Enterobacter kobei]|jgi:hypothetical protein|uniref:hypothetical protein n=1 Tax=Enterobacteriaceae TaxID=543 RepID=UPI000EFCB443|nr:hypothetical protein [Escherichia coli]MCX3187794.1 hypothetical protein [Escherichia coli]HDT6075178.1 hypothetical protein [Enterobacter roggenkampii]HEG2055123.1 hypothetical protein [Enterobacter kobei]